MKLERISMEGKNVTCTMGNAMFHPQKVSTMTTFAALTNSLTNTY